jgi:hypothetical protein
VDCKTNSATLEADQIERYMPTTGAELVVAGAVATGNPHEHQVNAVFVVLSGVEGEMVNIIAACPEQVSDGWGILRVTPSRFEIVHDELTDASLSTALTAGWDIDVARLPLERLPYEPDAPRWELATVIFRTVQAMFIKGVREFSLDDICVNSNELWSYLETQHDHIRKRIRDEMRTIRRTALKAWITRVDSETGREERWRFIRRPTSNQNVIAGFARRHQQYISILLDERDPRADDFVKIHPEQLALPILSESN